MRIEHFALQVPDPSAAAAWYVAHLGFEIRRQMEQPPQMHFLADSGGQVLIEIYRNPAAAVPDYRGQSPLIVHLALHSDDVVADRKRLLAAGATAVGDVDRMENGDVLAMLRDPWGVPIQLAQRGDPMI
jgi:catechol 2,3-dioxygenase-like lactoylglutathione lyase family enzyme